MHNFIGLNRQHDNFRKGVFIDPYDEPTYLTFALDFRFEDVVNGGMDQTSEALLEGSPLFSSGKDGAQQFLINRGYPAQANAMATFNAILKHLTFNAPWYFQSIKGIKTIYESSTNMKDSLRISPDSVLTVETLEAIDLRINELAGLYRNAILDLKYRRERVPDNLRWFTMDVYLAEFRNLRFRLPGVAQGAATVLGINTAALGNIVGGGNILSNVMEQFGYMKFTFRQCEFDFSGSAPFGDTVSVGSKGRSAETNSFKIKVGYAHEEVKYGDGTTIYDDLTKTDIKNPWGIKNLGTKLQNAGNFLSGLPIIGDDIQRAGQKAMDTLSTVGGLVNPALGAASSFFDPPVRDLGQINPYGYATNNDIVPTRPRQPSGKAN